MTIDLKNIQTLDDCLMTGAIFISDDLVVYLQNQGHEGDCPFESSLDAIIIYHVKENQGGYMFISGLSKKSLTPSFSMFWRLDLGRGWEKYTCQFSFFEGVGDPTLESSAILILISKWGYKIIILR